MPTVRETNFKVYSNFQAVFHQMKFIYEYRNLSNEVALTVFRPHKSLHKKVHMAGYGKLAIYWQGQRNRNFKNKKLFIV